MKVYLFDLLPYDRHFDEFKAERFMPWPLPGSHFDPQIAARTYAEPLAVWEEMDRLGYDGVGLNECRTRRISSRCAGSAARSCLPCRGIESRACLRRKAMRDQVRE
jgi:hypothetical protein